MADPVTIMAGVGLGASALGGVFGAVGAEQSAGASAAAYTYKAGVAMLNKQINLQNAAWATEAGETQSLETGLKGGAEKAQVKVTQAASGLDVNSGSNEATRDTITNVTDFNEGVIRWDAAKTSYGYETKAMTDEAEANLDTFAAKSAKEAGDINAITSILGGASSVSSKWLQGRSAGVF